LPPDTCAGPRTIVPFWTMATCSDTLSKPPSSTEFPIAVTWPPSSVTDPKFPEAGI
jgi:hypothetical protein